MPANCSGTITGGGHNLEFGGNSCGAGITQLNPKLGPLQDNGRPLIGVALTLVPTRALLPNRPAIDAGDDAACPARDERGYLRVSPFDIGAVERVFPLLMPLIDRWD